MLDKTENPIIDDIDQKEDMLYESTGIIEVGGDATETKIRDEMNGAGRIDLNFSAEMSVENQGLNVNGSFV